MILRANQKAIISILALSASAVAATGLSHAGFRSIQEVWGARFQSAVHPPAPTTHPPFHSGNPAAERIRHWNETAINASGLDHTPVAAGDTRVFGEQLG